MQLIILRQQLICQLTYVLVFCLLSAMPGTDVVYMKGVSQTQNPPANYLRHSALRYGGNFRTASVKCPNS
jgi:hypothetical protein